MGSDKKKKEGAGGREVGSKALVVFIGRETQRNDSWGLS